MLSALALSLTLAVTGAQDLVLPSGPEAESARTYMALIQAADRFDVDEVVALRDRLEASGGVFARLGPPPRYAELLTIGEPLDLRELDWWQGPRPDNDARVLIVWWSPHQARSRRAVLQAQALAEANDLDLIAVVVDGSTKDRTAAAPIVAQTQDVGFARAATADTLAWGVHDLPQVTLVEDGTIVWQGSWEQTAFTPLR